MFTFPGDFSSILKKVSPTEKVMKVNNSNPLLEAVNSLTTEDTQPIVIIPMQRQNPRPPSSIQPPDFLSDLLGGMPNAAISRVSVKKLDPKTGKLETLMDSGTGKEDDLLEKVSEPMKEVIKTVDKKKAK